MPVRVSFIMSFKVDLTSSYSLMESSHPSILATTSGIISLKSAISFLSFPTSSAEALANLSFKLINIKLYKIDQTLAID